MFCIHKNLDHVMSKFITYMEKSTSTEIEQSDTRKLPSLYTKMISCILEI